MAREGMLASGTDYDMTDADFVFNINLIKNIVSY